MKLNKMCIKDKATDSKASRAFRQTNDARIIQGRTTRKVHGIPDPQMSFGRANRPQTPVGGIIRNDFGEESANYMQQKYAAWNQMKSSTRGLTGIRMTNAQIAADNAIKAKLEVTKPQNEQKPQFKLKRFADVGAKTSTQRNGGGYASKQLVQQSHDALGRQE